MFKGGRGGFASYTKTGRSIAIGRSFGAAMARGTTSSASSSSASSSSASSSSKEPPAFVSFLFLLICAIILRTITQIVKQVQPQ